MDVEYQEGVLYRFERGPAQIGLVLGFEGGGGEEGFDCQPLGPLELVLVASPDHPLAAVELTDRCAHSTPSWWCATRHLILS